jgi:hypothetical protein
MSDESDKLRKESEEIRKELDIMTRRMEGGPLTEEEVHQMLEEARAWVNIIEESQASRQKFGQKLGADFQLELGNDAASLRSKIAELEKAVYGGFISAMRKRIENAERAINEAQP